MSTCKAEGGAQQMRGPQMEGIANEEQEDKI